MRIIRKLIKCHVPISARGSFRDSTINKQDGLGTSRGCQLISSIMITQHCFLALRAHIFFIALAELSTHARVAKRESEKEEKSLPPVENGWIFRDFPWENFPFFFLRLPLDNFAMGKSFQCSLFGCVLLCDLQLFLLPLLRLSTAHGFYLFGNFLLMRVLLHDNVIFVTTCKNMRELICWQFLGNTLEVRI